MRYLGVIILSLLWAQEEGRSRTEAPSLPPTRRTTPIRAPSKKEEVVVMETISGRVVDRNGAGIAKLRLWVVDADSGLVLGETYTSENGDYVFLLPSATRRVIVRMSNGKHFVEKEYDAAVLFKEESDILFEP